MRALRFISMELLIGTAVLVFCWSIYALVFVG